MFRWKRLGRSRRALTLIELLVVLTVILILASITLAVYAGFVRWSKDKLDTATHTRGSHVGHSSGPGAADPMSAAEE